jgi:hypothetical protein
MPSPAWREAFSIMWTDTDGAAKDAVEEAIRAGKSDCANYWCVGVIKIKKFINLYVCIPKQAKIRFRSPTNQLHERAGEKL